MNIQNVENLALLARIELKDEEKEEILADMKGILDYVKAIEAVQVPTEVGIPTAGGMGLYNITREDVLEMREFSQELIIGQFPDKQDGFLKVKKIL